MRGKRDLRKEIKPIAEWRYGFSQWLPIRYGTQDAWGRKANFRWPVKRKPEGGIEACQPSNNQALGAYLANLLKISKETLMRENAKKIATTEYSARDYTQDALAIKAQMSPIEWAASAMTHRRSIPANTGAWSVREEDFDDLIQAVYEDTEKLAQRHRARLQLEAQQLIERNQQ